MMKIMCVFMLFIHYHYYYFYYFLRYLNLGEYFMMLTSFCKYSSDDLYYL